MKQSNQKTKSMVSVALLMALIVVLQVFGGSIPPIGGFPISLVLIPIVVGSVMYGSATGALLGATFGLIVFINCVTGADVGGAMVFQANPVLCFLVVMGKGILAGFGAGFVYKMLAGKNQYLAVLCAAIICPVLNTGIFVTCMLAFFIDVLQVWAGDGGLTGYILTGLILTNFVPELILNIFFGPAAYRIIKIVKK